MQHALRHAHVVEELAEDPVRYLVLGPDRAGNLLELVVLDRPQGPAIIHAMAMRPQYRGLLSRERGSCWRRMALATTAPSSTPPQCKLWLTKPSEATTSRPSEGA